MVTLWTTQSLEEMFFGVPTVPKPSATFTLSLVQAPLQNQAKPNNTFLIQMFCTAKTA